MSPALLNRSDHLRGWADAPIGGYCLDGVRLDRLVLTDLGTGDVVETLNIGALTDRDEGQCVVGRLVPIGVSPGLMFESRPLGVPDDVAARVAGLGAGEPWEWLVPISEAREQRRLPLHFSSGGATPLTSDMLPEGWGNGGRQDVECGVGVCEVALFAVRVSGPTGAAATAPHVQAVLVDSGVHSAARQQLVAAGNADAWEIVADHVPEPVRSRCRELARLSRASAD